MDWENLPFGKVFTDHMFVMEYRDGSWSNPRITPFQNIEMHPAMSAIHYGQSIFEGLKAYRQHDGRLSVFRPDMNAKRFNESAKRMCMPEVPESWFIEAIRSLVKTDADWAPNKKGYSLYIRPFMFATDAWVGIKPSETYTFMVILSPVGNYYSEPVRVKIEPHYTRAAKGGVGRAKAAGNYGASMYPAKFAQDNGFHQLVWTDAKEHKYIEESGTMNLMFVINKVLSETIFASDAKSITTALPTLADSFIVSEDSIISNLLTKTEIATTLDYYNKVLQISSADGAETSEIIFIEDEIPHIDMVGVNESSRMIINKGIGDMLGITDSGIINTQDYVNGDFGTDFVGQVVYF